MMLSNRQRLWLIVGVSLVVIMSFSFISANPAFSEGDCASFPYNCQIHCDQSGCYQDMECDPDGVCIFSEWLSWDVIVLTWQIKELGLKAVETQASAQDTELLRQQRIEALSTNLKSLDSLSSDCSKSSQLQNQSQSDGKLARQMLAEKKLCTILEKSARIHLGLSSGGLPPQPAVFWQCGRGCLACAGSDCEFMINACNNNPNLLGIYDPNAQVGVCFH